MKEIKQLLTAAAVLAVFWLWGAGDRQAAQQHHRTPAATVAHSAPAKTAR